MMKEKAIWLVLVIFLIAGLLVGGIGCSASKATTSPVAPAPSPTASKAPTKIINYNHGSTSSTSGSFVLAVNLVDLANAAAPEQVSTVVESGAGHDNLVKMRSGMFAWASNTALDAQAMAWQGIDREEYIKAGPFTELRMLCIYARSVATVTVLADSGINTIEDLNGKKFSAGIPGSNSEFIFQSVMKGLGIKPDYFIGSLADAVQAAKDRRIDGYFKVASSGYLDASQIDLMTVRKIKLLSFTDEQIKVAMKARPGIFGNTWEANVIQQLAPHPPITSLMWYGGVAATSRIPQDIGYKMWKGITDNWNTGVAPNNPSSKGIDPLLDTLYACKEISAITSIPPLHAGMVQLMVEKGMDVPKMLIPPEYVAVR